MKPAGTFSPFCSDTATAKRKLDRLDDRELLTCKDAALALGLSRARLRRLVYAGKIPAERTHGGHLRFTPAALADYLKHFTSAAPVAGERL